MSGSHLKSFIFLSTVFGYFCLFHDTLFAQAFTFDYLTYSDNYPSGRTAFSKGKMTAFVFWGRSEFEDTGKTSGRLSYREMYLYAAPRIFTSNSIQIMAAFQSSLLIAKRDLVFISIGTPWLWGKVRPIQRYPVELRFGFNWGKLGRSYWLEDNKFDIGILSSKNFGFVALDASFSYRIRNRSNQRYFDFIGSYDQPGNEIHYKLEASKKIGQKIFVSAIAFGYFSQDKRLSGDVLPDSHSQKTTVGASIVFKTNTSRYYLLSFLYDAAGRYDMQGFAVVLNVTD